MSAVKVQNLNYAVPEKRILHDINLALAYADRLVLLKNGRIHRILEQPSALTDELLREVFEVDLRVITNPLTGQPLVVYAGPAV